MTKITSFDLTPFYRNTIGVDRLFDRIVNQIDHAATNNYPPYNIAETGENTYVIQVAVAGFTQGEIDVMVKDDQLIITGEKDISQETETWNYRHQGISARKFVRTFSLADHVEVKEAVNKDGILTVKLERIVPESAKPKSIAINYQS
jgi:molecular chaperone IbpA